MQTPHTYKAPPEAPPEASPGTSPEAPAFAALLPAAGSGSRFGQGDKLLVPLLNQSVLQRSVALFTARPDISTIVLVTAKDRFALYADHLAPTLNGKKLLLVEGGRERWESVLLGLRALAASPTPPPFVAIHDAARPLTPQPVIDQAFAATLRTHAALPCLAEPATLKRRSPEGLVSETVDRRNLFQAQTPQCFHLATLLQAFETLLQKNQLADVTDDAQVYERAYERTNHPVTITPGSPLNMKITTAEDIALAQAILSTFETPNFPSPYPPQQK